MIIYGEGGSTQTHIHTHTHPTHTHRVSVKIFCALFVSDVVVDEITVSPVRNTTTSFHQGDDVTLTCNATNPPDVTRPLMFTWVLGSNELPSKEVTNDTSNGITVVNGEDYSILSFIKIQDDTDIEGLYQCRVTNRERADWVTVSVNVDVICEFNPCT